MYIMLEGSAQATKVGINDDDDKPKVLMEYEKGEWFGELALIADQKRSASITAVGDVQVRSNASPQCIGHVSGATRTAAC